MATQKLLENQVRYLNRQMGFTGRKYKRLKNGKLRVSGSGFGLDYAYGGVSLVFEPKGSTTQRTVSPRMSKKNLSAYIDAVGEGARYYKQRAKYK